jgi:hypothetical protein
MRLPARFSQISSARQLLVRLCQRVNHGSIEGMEIRESEPMFNSAPVVVRNIKLGVDEPPRPELDLSDFALNDHFLSMLGTLDQLESGTIRKIEITAGIPTRILVESSVLSLMKDLRQSSST